MALLRVVIAMIPLAWPYPKYWRNEVFNSYVPWSSLTALGKNNGLFHKTEFVRYYDRTSVTAFRFWDHAQQIQYAHVIVQVCTHQVKQLFFLLEYVYSQDNIMKMLCSNCMKTTWRTTQCRDIKIENHNLIMACVSSDSGQQLCVLLQPLTYKGNPTHRHALCQDFSNRFLEIGQSVGWSVGLLVSQSVG